MERLARFGYAARGVVYVLLGWLALRGGIGGSGEGGADAVFSTLLSAPFGRIILGSVAFGLAGHVLWRMAQAFLNADHHDTDAKGVAARATNFVSGLLNAALAFSAARLALRSGTSGGGESFAMWLVELPFGMWLLALAGGAAMAAGAVQIWRGLTAHYQKRVRLPPGSVLPWHAVCAFGLAARGFLLVVIGGFLVYAAITVDPGQAGSTMQALDWIRTLPFGAWLYMLASAGLVAFGFYSFAEALYRRVSAPSSADLKQAARTSFS